MYKVILGLLILLPALMVACGGDDESTPSATEEATERATATESATGAADGAEQTFSSSQLPISVKVTTLAGWEQPSDADLPDLFAVVDPGIGYLDFLQPTQVYVYASETESEVTGPPASYEDWFNENPFANVIAGEDVTVGGLQGRRLEITNNDNEPFALFKLSDGSDYDLAYRDHIYADILDAGGTQIIVICGPEDPATFADFTQACEEVLTTVEFGT